LINYLSDQPQFSEESAHGAGSRITNSSTLANYFSQVGASFWGFCMTMAEMIAPRAFQLESYYLQLY
jgi:hypothetical protein